MRDLEVSRARAGRGFQFQIFWAANNGANDNDRTISLISAQSIIAHGKERAVARLAKGSGGDCPRARYAGEKSRRERKRENESVAAII